MNSAAFIIIAILTLGAALAAATLQKLMHAALSFAGAFVGVAALFFLLGAEFVGLVLVFIYIGAVAVLIVFTILLTRRDVGRNRGFNWGGAPVAVAVFGSLTWSILKTQSLAIIAPHMPALTVKQIGAAFMTTYVWLLPLPLPKPPLVLPWLSPFIATTTRPTSISLTNSGDEFLGPNLSLVDSRSAVGGFVDHFEFVERAAEKRSRARRNWRGTRARA